MATTMDSGIAELVTHMTDAEYERVVRARAEFLISAAFRPTFLQLPIKSQAFGLWFFAELAKLEDAPKYKALYLARFEPGVTDSVSTLWTPQLGTGT